MRSSLTPANWLLDLRHFLPPCPLAARLAACFAAVVTAGHPLDAAAQKATTPTFRARDLTALPLQDVPISIVAITGQDLESRGLDNLEELSQGVPNVVITGGGGGTGGTSFRIRGIPNVGTYIDGVWQVGTAGFLTNE